MTQIESPKRKMQKKNDYQRHKLFRKIKRRNKAQAQADQEIAEKQLKKKLKLPKFKRGNDANEIYKSNAHINEDGTVTDISTGKTYDSLRAPEIVVNARRVPTFKDIEKQIGRKITQDEIDKVVAVDPEIKLQLPNTPKEKGMYQPSVSNEIINTVFGSIGDAANYVANKAGLPNVAPGEQLIETKDGDALFDLPVYGKAVEQSLYGISKLGGKLGLKSIQDKARRAILNKEFLNSSIDNKAAEQLALSNFGTKEIRLSKPTYKLNMSSTDSGLADAGESVELSKDVSPISIAHENSQIVRPDGTVNMRNLVRARQQLRQLYPNSRDPKRIFNSDFLTGRRTNLNQHTSDVVKTAQDIPVPTGYTRQDLVQAALGHDIGKVLDVKQGVHEQLSADMLINAIRKDGFIGTQDIKPDVIQAIAEHGLGAKSIELDPLTQALHVADVTRGASYDQAAIHAGYLFNYPREYPKWNFQNKSLHDEIVQNINPVLKRQGYQTIDPNSTLQEAEAALNNVIDEHRTFIRGVHDTKFGKAESYMLTDLPVSEKIANGGRRGISGYRRFYGFPQSRYDGLYLSTNADFLNLYGNAGEGGKVGIVRIPQNETSKTSNSLSERLLAGDFDTYNSNQIYSGYAGNPQSSWTLFGEPYRLQTGRSLQQDMIAKDPNVPKIQYQKVVDEVNANQEYGFFGNKTYGDVVNYINQYLKENGKTQIKGLFKTDGQGNLIYDAPFYYNSKWIKQMESLINELKNFDEADISEKHFKELNKLNEEYSDKLRRSFFEGQLYGDPEIYKKINDVRLEFKRISKAKSFINDLKNKGIISEKQYKAVKFSGNSKYFKDFVLKKYLNDYFESLNKVKADFSERTKYLNIPENQAAFMRKQGVLPRYEHPTYNHVLTITPGQHAEDMPKKMATKNQYLGPSQIAVVGKRGKKVVDLVKELGPDEIKEVYKKSVAKSTPKLHKPTKKSYKDTGDRIHGIKVSRKTLQ